MPLKDRLRDSGVPSERLLPVLPSVGAHHSERFVSMLSKDGFQPMAGAPIEEMLTSKLPVDPRLPLTALEQANRNGLPPASAYCGAMFFGLESPSKGKFARFTFSNMKGLPRLP